MSANDRQVGGGHYGGRVMQHWDLVAYYGWDYYQAQIIKYVMRWEEKNGIEDLKKAQHFLEKYIEVREQKGEEALQGGEGHPTKDYTNQDPDLKQG